MLNLLSFLLATALAGGSPPGSAPEFKTDFSRHSVPYTEILRGGPPKDGIPAIDEPKFVSPEEAAEWIAPEEPVVRVQVSDDLRAYPLQILTWHEIVHDTVGGTPLVVTFCPLCNTAIAFERTVGGEVLDFGATGRLRFSNLLLYGARVLNIDQGDESVAYPYGVLEEQRVVHDTLDDEPVVVWWSPGTRSALDAREIAEGRDVGAAIAFSRRVGEQTLHFEHRDETFVDRETGSRWRHEGLAVAGPLRGTRLEPVVSIDHFWFSWAAFRPETRVFHP